MNSSQIDALNRAINQFSEEEKILILPNRFAYIFSKAWLYMKLGPEKYRKTDAFNQPPSDLDKEDLEIIANGCRQVLEGIGLTKEKPFTNLDVMGFSALFRLFHFQNIQRQCRHGFMLNWLKPNFAQKQHVLFHNANFPGIFDIRKLKPNFPGMQELFNTNINVYLN